VLDIGMPGMGGVAALKAIKERWPVTEVVMVTAVREVDQVVACMKAGAYDFLSKPWDAAALRTVVRRAADKWRLERENLVLRSSQTPMPVPTLVGLSHAMQKVRDRVQRLADSEANVLITGESGTGKELVARAVHDLSPRREARFVAIACAAIPRDMVESELFGHEKGAFTSAMATRTGKFEYASGGTLFLDDIPTLPLEAQAKLLRVLEERAVTRLGSNRAISVDVRIIASSNQDLERLVQSGDFRADLYYRLNGVPIELPPLRERGDDLEDLLRLFVERACAKQGRPPKAVHPEVPRLLKCHSFPGNVRELINLAETLVAISEDETITKESLPASILRLAQGASHTTELTPLKDQLKVFERQILIRALAQVAGNQTLAAKALGIHRNTLILKMQDLGL